MRITRARTALFLFLCCIGLNADETRPSQKVTVTGILHRVMAVGAETTGWSVEVTSDTMIDGKPISSIEVSDTRKPDELNNFVNKTVKITGKVLYRHGVETETQPYIEISSIKAVTQKASSSPAQPASEAPNLADQWTGRWNGPEGTYLEIAKQSGQYRIDIRDLDGSRTFVGTAEGPGIAFMRDGQKVLLTAGDGQATGMKWLLDKKNCLLTKAGEGWCRN